MYSSDVSRSKKRRHDRDFFAVHVVLFCTAASILVKQANDEYNELNKTVLCEF